MSRFVGSYPQAGPFGHCRDLIVASPRDGTSSHTLHWHSLAGREGQAYADEEIRSGTIICSRQVPEGLDATRRDRYRGSAVSRCSHDLSKARRRRYADHGIPFDTERETLLVLSYGKAVESRKRRPILYDAKALEIVQSIDYDISALKIP